MKRKLRTHCKKGHRLTPGNTYVNPRGKRRCRLCYRRSHREWERAAAWAKRLARPLRVCVFCGCVLSRTMRADAVMCGRPECVAARSRESRRKRAGWDGAAMADRACSVCGASLDGRRVDALTCSSACRREASRRRAKVPETRAFRTPEE